MNRRDTHQDRNKEKPDPAKREQRRRRRIARKVALNDNREMPADAAPADISQQVPSNSYDPPPRWYQDIEFTCVDCGSEEVWTATQQKWWYEVAKGSLHATANRCRSCRRKRLDAGTGRNDMGDPYPIKHIGSLLKHIRSSLAPPLHLLKFTLAEPSGRKIDRKTHRREERRDELVFQRSDDILLIRVERWDETTIVEHMDPNGVCNIIVKQVMNRMRPNLLHTQIESLTAAVLDYVATQVRGSGS